MENFYRQHYFVNMVTTAFTCGKIFQIGIFLDPNYYEEMTNDNGKDLQFREKGILMATVLKEEHNFWVLS